MSSPGLTPRISLPKSLLNLDLSIEGGAGIGKISMAIMNEWRGENGDGSKGGALSLYMHVHIGSRSEPEVCASCGRDDTRNRSRDDKVRLYTYTTMKYQICMRSVNVYEYM